jgi:hypothetical protein
MYGMQASEKVAGASHVTRDPFSNLESRSIASTQQIIPKPKHRINATNHPEAAKIRSKRAFKAR